MKVLKVSCLRGLVTLSAAVILFSILQAKAETTNTLSDAEIQGRALVQKILGQRPAENFTNTGSLQIRDAKGTHLTIPVECKTVVTMTNWQSIYKASWTNKTEGLWVIHAANTSNAYGHDTGYLVGDIPVLGHLFSGPKKLSDAEVMIPFAGSDFWLCDLGLEFFHWPQQKVLKKEFHRQCACTVLESTNPNPAPNGYSRVVSWIDEDSLGIVEAWAYVVNGKQLKNFYPKNFEKVNGQYQLQSMVMENVQTGSRTVLEFDLNK